MTEEEKRQRAREAEARYRAKNKEAIRAKQAIYRANNQEKIKSLRVAYRSNPENKAKELAYNKKWIEENKDKVRERSKREYYRNYDAHKKYRDENSRARSLYSQKWNRANKERRKTYMSAYQKANPEKFQEAQQKRRAVMRNAPVSERNAICRWIKEWRSMREVACHWCHGVFHPSECHSDHVVPLGRDGAHCLSNMVIACKKCNTTKNAQDIETWMKIISQKS